jgi:hypothetical protein
MFRVAEFGLVGMFIALTTTYALATAHNFHLQPA